MALRVFEYLRYEHLYLQHFEDCRNRHIASTGLSAVKWIEHLSSSKRHQFQTQINCPLFGHPDCHRTWPIDTQYGSASWVLIFCSSFSEPYGSPFHCSHALGIDESTKSAGFRPIEQFTVVLKQVANKAAPFGCDAFRTTTASTFRLANELSDHV